MKKRFIILLAASLLVVLRPNVRAVDTNSIPAELNAVIARVNAKLEQGKYTEADLAENLKEYDALYARHRGETSDVVASILLAKANLYTQVLNNPAKAVEVIKQIKQDYPGVAVNGDTDGTIAALQRKATAMTLVVGAPFLDFNEKDVNGQSQSVSEYKGKVVLIDFWATWCPPCRLELPDIVTVYKKYHGQGLEIIGVSLDDDKQQMLDVTKKLGMTWPQIMDGQGWSGKLVMKYDIEAIPANFLIGRDGKIIGKNIHGDELIQAIAKAVGAK